MDDCVKEFENMKKSKAYYGIVYKLSQDLKFIEVDKKFENPTGDETDTTVEEYQKFANYLLAMEEEKDCRYACYDVRLRRAKASDATNWSSSPSVPRTPRSSTRWCTRPARTRSSQSSSGFSTFRPTTPPISPSTTS